MRYAKAGVAVLAAIISALVPYVASGHVTTLEWLTVAIAGASAASVFAAPNVPHSPITKFTLSVIMAVLQLAVALIAAGTPPTAVWLQLVVAAAGAAGVYSVKNVPEPAV